MVGGTVKSVTLVDTPMATYVAASSGEKAEVLVSTTANCLGDVDLSLRLLVDVTTVFTGDLVPGVITVTIGGSQADQMSPRAVGGAGSTPTWDGAGESLPFAPGSWVGLPLILVPDHGWSVAFETPFTATETVDLSRYESCGSFPRPVGLDGMPYEQLAKEASLCAVGPTAYLQSRVAFAERRPAYAYAARCHAPIIVHECDTDADCLNSTVCQKNICVVPGFGG